MESRFGITGCCLDWFKNYLSNRSQFIQIDEMTSEPKFLHFGVPQGSVLGPILFTMYTVPLGDITKQHNIMHHFYADETQLYVTLDPNQTLAPS